MKIVFKKIPRWAKVCYSIGGIGLSLAMWQFYSEAPALTSLRIQQLFILSAIIVAIGSVINTLQQFKK